MATRVWPCQNDINESSVELTAKHQKSFMLVRIIDFLISTGFNSFKATSSSWVIHTGDHDIQQLCTERFLCVWCKAYFLVVTLLGNDDKFATKNKTSILLYLTLLTRNHRSTRSVGSSCRATTGYSTIHYKYADLHRKLNTVCACVYMYNCVCMRTRECIYKLVCHSRQMETSETNLILFWGNCQMQETVYCYSILQHLLPFMAHTHTAMCLHLSALLHACQYSVLLHLLQPIWVFKKQTGASLTLKNSKYMKKLIHFYGLSLGIWKNCTNLKDTKIWSLLSNVVTETSKEFTDTNRQKP